MKRKMFIYVVIVASILVAAAVVVVLVKWAFNESNKSDNYRKLLDEMTESGNKGKAEILESEYVGIDLYNNGKSSFKLRLKVYPDDGGSPYVVDRDPTCPVGWYLIGAPFTDRLKKVGSIVPILIHPFDPTKIILDVDKIEKDAQSGKEE
jgi:hypothetical protein